ncbi:ABC transporter permease [Nanoarchaeota archaeon]
MKLNKCFKLAFNMVVHSKLRSWLTIIGIVIGVGSVIAIMSLGAGMEASVNSRLGGLGADLVTLTAGAQKSMRMHGGGGGSSGGATATDEIPQLDRSDVQAIKGVPDVIAIDMRIGGKVDISYLGKKGSVSLTGVDQKTWAQVTTDTLRDGRLLGPSDQNVIVIGARLADEFFDSPIGINKMVTIENNAFRVVGILEEGGTNIRIPIQMAYQLLDDKEQDVYDTIIAKARNEDVVEEVADKIERKLFVTRHVNEKTKDFSIMTLAQIAESVGAIIGAITLFLTAIAAVSLLVGAVGIANTMFTAVLEKTKDIGIMKAIGARNTDIMIIFLLNSALIGLIGGIIGVGFGLLLSNLIGFIIPDMRMMSGGTIVSVMSIFLSLGVAIFVGISAGVIPAYQASKLKPVDALRYE